MLSMKLIILALVATKTRSVAAPVRALVFLLLCAPQVPSFAHGGGLDANGCHHNRKTGDYHCHRPKVNAVPQQPVTTQVQPSKMPTAPQCFVGPRGGTYTITSSGRKNYGGC